MSYVRYFILFLIVLFASCNIQNTSPCSKILKYAEAHLPHCGVLKSSSGFVYVDVDDEYIHKLASFIQQEGFEEPPYFGNADLVGAHITVIYPDELKNLSMREIQECGKMVYFTLKGCEVVHPQRWKGIDEVYFIAVDAPELDLIREKYGLPKREYSFHITIGVKPKKTKAA